MKKPQFITIGTAIFLVAVIYFFGRTTPYRNSTSSATDHTHSHSNEAGNLTDTILNMAKSQITPEQVIRITTLENSISRGAVKDQQLKVYHQLGHFWGDTAGLFLPYAFYEAEAARLENSEKTLTFAARLFLDNLQDEENMRFRRWEGLQAKDLFERSLMINPDNDSTKAGLAACYLLGGIADDPAVPMKEGVGQLLNLIKKDSTNTYAQMILAKGAMYSGQNDKAIARLQTITRLRPNDLEAVLMLADVYERTGDKENAIKWYQASLKLVNNRPDARSDIEKRIAELKK